MQQATVNLLADMGVQPRRCRPAWSPRRQSTDTTGPVTAITAPGRRRDVQHGPPSRSPAPPPTSRRRGRRVSRSPPTAEHLAPATGGRRGPTRWTPTGAGAVADQVRAADDSGNIGAVAGVPMTVSARSCPAPSGRATADAGRDGDDGAVELGVKFRTDRRRFDHRRPLLQGHRQHRHPHRHPVDGPGTQLATGTFTNETASGWQQLNFASPVTVTANTTYIASYFAPNGGYSYDGGLLHRQGRRTRPAHRAPSPAPTAGTASTATARRGGFPSTPSSGSNYWVDVVLDTSDRQYDAAVGHRRLADVGRDQRVDHGTRDGRLRPAGRRRHPDASP